MGIFEQGITEGQFDEFLHKVLRPVEEVKLPEESHGACKNCGAVAFLGDGLCPKCWDSHDARRNALYQRAQDAGLAKRMKAEGRSVSEIALHMGVSRRTVERMLYGGKNG